MATDKKISELPDASLPIVSGVKFEALQGGINVKVDADDMPGSGGGAVASVNGQTGVVDLDAGDLTGNKFNFVLVQTLRNLYNY